jgi:hypothetical protein
MANVETKLSVLDQIGSRLDKMEKNYGKVDTDMLDCKNRISNLEKSAQFLSNIHDEHKALKYIKLTLLIVALRQIKVTIKSSVIV